MARRIHVQHVVLSLQPGGLENGVVNVVNRLDGERFRSSICCLKDAGEFKSRLSNRDGTVHEMGWKGGTDLMMALRMARLFRRTGTDIVHTRNAEAYFYGFVAAKLAGIRCIVHSEHGRTFDDRPIRFLVQRWFSRFTQVIFAVSEQLKRDMTAHIGIPASRISVLHNGVDLTRFSSGGRTAARQQLALGESDLALAAVGRLAAVKNFALMLRALANLGRSDVIGVFLGDGPERANLEALAASLGISGRVRFLGHRDDVATLLPAMDVFVLPSVSEGMSNTLLEAMAAGVPCVASRVGGNCELIDHDGDGLLFASGNEAQLRGMLLQLCADRNLRQRLADAARLRVLRDFSLPAMIARYENLYSNAMAAAEGKS